MIEAIIGMDPGVSGGAALITKEGEILDQEWFENPYKFTGRTIDDIADWFHLISDFADIKVKRVYIERVGGMIGDSPSKLKVFMENYGACQMAAAMSKFSREYVKPLVWQTKMNCKSKGGNKKIPYAKARELFPDIKITLATADAVVIAECGRRMEYGL